MKNQHAFFIIILVAAIILVRFDLVRREDSQVKVTVKNRPIAMESARAPANIEPAFMEAFNREAPAIAKLTDSELSSEQLRALARQMKPQDAEALYQVISDENNSDEIRSVAIDLLTVKNDTASMMALKKFVGNKTTVNGKPWNTKKELETILRAQAVESIAAYPQKEIAFSTLSFLQRQVEEKFLNERIGRAAAQVSGLQAEASTAPAEDENLKQLVQ